MKIYIAIFLNYVKLSLTYRFQLVTQIFTQMSGIVLSVFMWSAIYQSSSLNSIGGFSKTEMLLYLTLSGISSLLFANESVLWIGGLVKSGKLTVRLLRPYSLLGEFFAMNIGKKIVFLVFFFMIGFILFLTRPGFYTLLLFLYSISIFVMYYLLLALIGTIGFWMIEVWPLRTLMNALYLLLAGVLFPLNLLPDSLYELVKFLPFSLVGYRYSMAMQMKLSIRELLFQCEISLVWALVLFVLYQLMYRQGLKKYEGVSA